MRSAELPGWWSVRLKNRPNVQAEIELLGDLSAGQGPDMDDRLEELAITVARADALKMAGRTQVIQFRPWASSDPRLRLASAHVRSAPGRIEVHLRPDVDLPGPGLAQAEGIWATGQDVRFELSPALVAALAQAGGPEGSSATTEPGGSHSVEVRGLAFDNERLTLDFRARQREQCGWFDGAAPLEAGAGDAGSTLRVAEGPVGLIGNGGQERFPTQAALVSSAERASADLLAPFESLALLDPRGRSVDVDFYGVGKSSVAFSGSLKGKRPAVAPGSAPPRRLPERLQRSRTPRVPRASPR